MNSSTSSSDGLARHGAAALAVALVVGLGFAAVTESLVRLAVEPVDLLARHIDFFDHADSADVAFGDSHMSLGFTGAAGFVNLAFPGENLATIAGKVQLYYRGRQPGRVILQADPSMLAPVRDAEPAIPYEPFLAQASGGWLASLTPRHRPRLTAYWRVWLDGGGFAANRTVEADGAQTMIGLLSDLSDTQRRAVATDEAAGQRPGVDFSDSQGLRILDDLVAGLSRRGAKVCLVTMPMSPEYRAFADGVLEFAAAREAFTDIAKSHGASRADLWDAVTDPSLFLNQDHMNRNGARILAPMIVEDCFP